MKTRIQQTCNYSQFCLAQENRDVNITHLRSEHKRLKASMRHYGFLPSCPITVRAINGRFEILDGQHRFTFARELRLPVWFVVVDADIDIAEINQTAATWRVEDYARRWAKAGRPAYVEAIAFAEKHGVSLGYAFSILGGTLFFSNVSAKVRSGDYRVTERGWASRVGEAFSAICSIASVSNKRSIFQALAACTLVRYFDESRLIETLKSQPDLLVSAGTRDAYLQLLENIYNFRRRSREPLAFDATEAVHARSAVVTSKRRGNSRSRVMRRTVDKHEAAQKEAA